MLPAGALPGVPGGLPPTRKLLLEHVGFVMKNGEVVRQAR
jgi:hypothetical protein